MIMALTNSDLKSIADLFEPRFEEIRSEFHAVHRRIDNLTQSMDEFVHMARRHDQEWLIVRAQHEKMRNVLIKKGIASEDELSVTS